MNFLNYALPRHRPIYLWDERLVFACWRKMLDKGARVFYPAHGKPFPAEELNQYLMRFAPNPVP